MRLTALAAFILLAGAAQAQTPLTGTTGPLGSPNAGSRPGTEQLAPAAAPTSAPAAAGTAHRRGRSLQERFELSNTTHDGHLTLEQARSHMPSVARDFAEIDTDKKGYVTIDQIREHTKAKRAATRAARRAAAAKPQ